MKITEKVEKYYSGKISKYGATNKGVDWSTEESQILRFKQLCKILPDTNSQVLDFGCGYGAMYEYLNLNFPKIKYSGFDLSRKMIDAARTKYKKVDFFEKLPKSYITDYTIASGIFNVKLEIVDSEWKAYILETLEKINNVSTKGFSFNILTSYSDKEFMKNYLYYADPLYFFDYCKKHFSKNVALLHDYNLYEFTILIKKK